MSEPDLYPLFVEINFTHFSGALPVPLLKWNSRLRSSAGRFVPGSRKFFMEVRPVIEVASYLTGLEKSEAHIWDTLAHEMIHYWLWLRRKPYGHTREFVEKMKSMGVSRYNPVPIQRPHKYMYICPECKKEFLVRRRIKPSACKKCCQEWANGKFDVRFRLQFMKEL